MKSLVLAASAFAAFVSGGIELDDSARRFIAEQYGSTNAVGRLSSEEALRAVDEVFGKGDRAASDDLRRKLKRLLSDGFGEMYAYGCYNDYRKELGQKHLLVDTVPEVSWPDSEGYRGLIPELWEDRYFEISAEASASNPEGSVFGLLHNRESVALILPPVKSFTASTSRVDAVSREVVADIETVRLQSLMQLDVTACEKPEGRYYGSFGKARANYLVTLRVRATLTGDCAFKRFSFPVVFGKPVPTPHGTWLFHRGMTLAVGFGMVDGEERVVRIDPVLPYPPYTKDGVRLYRGVDRPVNGVRSFFKWPLPGISSERSLGVSYGDHTFVRYAFPSNLLSGVLGTFPDFSVHERIDVWTDGVAARPDYWRDAWFSCPGRPWDDEDLTRVSVRPALAEFDGREGRDGVAALRFMLRGLSIPSVSFRPPATMKDVADFFTVATSTLCRDRNPIAFAADASCVNREVRPFEVRDIAALTAFKKVCARNGCVFTVDGTNVTIRAGLTEEQCRHPDLAALLSSLQAQGFASVKGATPCSLSVETDVDVGDTSNDEDPDYEEGRRIRESVKQEFLPGFRCKMALPRVDWVKPMAGDDNQVRFVALGCTWWEKKLESPSCVSPIKRLPRVVGRLVFALEEEMEVDAYRTLTFALQLQELGYGDDAARIAGLLWNRPLDAMAALRKLRETLVRVKEEYPTCEAWCEKKNREFEDRRRRRDGIENPDDEDEKEDDGK